MNSTLHFFTTSEDWYPDLDDQDADRVDAIINGIFYGSIKIKGLKLKPINNGIYFDVVDLICGRSEIDTKRSQPEPGGTFFKMTHTENTDIIEMQDFGMRPFRHAGWDRLAVEEADRVLGGSGNHPNYSIHSPEQVAQLLEEAKTGENLLAGVDDSELVADYNEEFLRPLSDAAKAKRAIFVAADT